ncbi:hypothetical protein B0I35DRAFT_479631 [Stachybotrys elegans]|uniref:Uncharacterized protein n=1 Tax=Stachybotrys elegans TaxID=80388 RepID=A0A8K0SQ73_9HYPO|nr:hypothetical protein B0I35DRAFT_479631 [Stachybotrys elegans]
MENRPPPRDAPQSNRPMSRGTIYPASTVKRRGLAQTEPEPLSVQRQLKAPRSMSFLRTHAQSRSTSRAENDMAVNLAHNKLRLEVGQHQQQNKLNSYPSMLFRKKNKRSESSMDSQKEFRKSMRDTSNTTVPLTSYFSNDSSVVTKHASLRGTARKVSRSLKNKLKGLFTRPKSTDEQHSDEVVNEVVNEVAHGEPVNDERIPGEPVNDERTPGIDSDDDYNMDDVVHPTGEASFARGPSRRPSIHAVPFGQQLRSLQGSLENIACGDSRAGDERSRVTSWTDSTANTTVGMEGSGDWDRRLSIINENGAHVSSASLHRRSFEAGLPHGQLPAGSSADHKRMYSSLVRRLEDLREGQERLKRKSMGDLRPFESMPPHSSSLDYPEARGWSPATIRFVPDDDDVFMDQSTQQMKENRPPNRLSTNKAIDEPVYSNETDQAMNESVLANKPVYNTVTGSERRHALSSRSSAFFASPTSHLFRTASPYRRALQETMNATQEPVQSRHAGPSYLRSLSDLSLPPRQPSVAGLDQVMSADDDSIYSPPTPDRPNVSLLNRGSTTANSSQAPTAPTYGEATIYSNTTRARRERPQVSHARDISTASSVEWKTWLSSNVSKLESSPLANAASSQNGTVYALPSLGHVRERAELGSPLDE